MGAFQSIDPEQFISKLNQKELDDALIIDVREQHEWEYYHLDEAMHLPMNTIPGKLELLPRSKPIYVICAHGVRSQHVCHYLQQQGYESLNNVEGGMAALASLRGFQYD